MRKLIAALALVAVVSGVIAVAPASATGRFVVLQAKSTGDQEVPEPVDTDARGRAVFVIDKERETIRFVAFATRIEGVTESHIHLGEAGANGPVAAFLFDFDGIPGNVGDTEEGTRRGFFRVGKLTQDDIVIPDLTMAELIATMETGGAYVNTHTLAVRSGEIRGQIG